MKDFWFLNSINQKFDTCDWLCILIFLKRFLDINICFMIFWLPTHASKSCLQWNNSLDDISLKYSKTKSSLESW